MFAPITRLVIRRPGLVLVACTVFACALFWPVVIHLGSTIIGSPGSDSTGSVGFFWTLTHESGFHLLGTTHHTFSGAPFSHASSSSGRKRQRRVPGSRL